ncbi:MAG: class I SAM-dependent methyltransferase [Glycocaulis sp.]
MDGKQSWTQYWKSGQLHSCFVAGTPFETSHIWSPFLDQLPDGSRVLDLACGAGALTRLAVGAQRGFLVTGVDYASALPSIPGAEVRPDTALESLPFPDGAFDAVISQFGLEYADGGFALAEALRVLAGGGRFAFLAHADTSAAVEAARVRVENVSGMTSPDGPVALAIDFGLQRESGAAQAQSLEAIARAFKREAERPRDETLQWALGFLSELMQKQAQFPPAYLYENGRVLMGELKSYSARLAMMIDAALSEAALDDLSEEAIRLGARIEERRLVHDSQDQPVAWWFSATRV